MCNMAHPRFFDLVTLGSNYRGNVHMQTAQLSASDSNLNWPADWDGVNRRAETEDRRSYSFKTLKHQVLAPQRNAGRRIEDRRFPVLDRFDNGLFTLAMTLLCLSILDSIFTLTLIANGGTEVNPFMNAMLNISLWAFAGVKMFLTAVPAVLLVATANVKLFGLFRSRTILASAVGFYAGLIFYEISLLSLIY